MEIRKTSGEPYPGNTLRDILISLRQYCSINGREVKFLNDPEFISLKHTLDARMRELSAEGIAVRRRQADIISEDDENKLWEKGVLGNDSSQKL